VEPRDVTDFWCAPGRKVVCIDDDFEPHDPGDPVVNGVYEVDGLQLNDWSRVMLSLVGFPEWAYRADCFRPAVEREVDISVFERLLMPLKVEEDA
jgi:hypothetical protein